MTVTQLQQHFFVHHIHRAGNCIVDMMLVINSTVGDFFINQKQAIKLQFVFIRNNCSVSSLMSNFDIDATQLSFDGENVLATRAAIESLSTKTIIHYGLTRDQADYPHFALRLNKYLQRGFHLLTPRQFSMTQFINCPLHMSHPQDDDHGHNNNNLLHADHPSPIAEERSHMDLNQYGRFFSKFNRIATVWGRNCDMFGIQNQFRLCVLNQNE